MAEIEKMSKRPKADRLDLNEWSLILRDIQMYGRAMPAGYAARDCFADASSENDKIRRNAERAAEAMDRRSCLPSDTE